MSFGKRSHIVKIKKHSQYMRTRVLNQCIPFVLTYGSQTWIFTKKNIYRIANGEIDSVHQVHREKEEHVDICFLSISF